MRMCVCVCYLVEHHLTLVLTSPEITITDCCKSINAFIFFIIYSLNLITLQITKSYHFVPYFTLFYQISVIGLDSCCRKLYCWILLLLLLMNPPEKQAKATLNSTCNKLACSKAMLKCVYNNKTTLCSKKRPPFYFLNNSVKN